MKKFLAILLSLLMLVSMSAMLSACDKDEAAEGDDTTDTTLVNSDDHSDADNQNDAPVDNQSIVGTWSTTVDLADLINNTTATDAEVGSYLNISKFEMTMNMTFDNAGTYEMSVDTDALKQSVESVKKDIEDGLKKYVEDQITATGSSLSVEDFLQQQGTTMDEMVDEFGLDDLIDDMTEGSSQQGKYEAVDGKLYTSYGLDEEVDKTEYETYTITGNTMTVVSDEETMTFTRVK